MKIRTLKTKKKEVFNLYRINFFSWRKGKKEKKRKTMILIKFRIFWNLNAFNCCFSLSLINIS